MTSPTPGSELMPNGGAIFHDTVFRQKVLDMSSYICLNLVGRAQERIQVARALHVVQHNIDVSLRAVLSIQVDGICVRVPARDAKKLERRIKSIRYCDLHKLTSPLPRAVAKVRQTPSTSTEQVYKCEALEEPKYPGGRLEIAPHVPPPYPEPLEWNVVREPMEGDDTFVADVLAHVLGGKSCCIEGPPGTGKSWMLRQIREALEKDGQNVRVAAPTNKAARLVDGITLHNFVSIYCRNGSFRGVLLIDEISMLHLGLISSCDHLRLGDCRIICLGDWAQLPVVGNSWRGTPIDSQIFRHSRLYRVWSDCTRFELTRPRRCNAEHFAFYTSLPDNLAQTIAVCRKRFQMAQDADLHVCLSNRRRRYISQNKQAAAAAGKICISVPAWDDPGYKCFVGTQVIGCCTSGRIINSVSYTVAQLVNNDKVLLRDDGLGESFEISTEQLAKTTQLGWAVTYHKLQGESEDRTLLLHDLGHKHMTRAHAYMGVSRVRDGARVFVARE